MNSNEKYPFVFFTKLIPSASSGYPPYSMLIVFDGTNAYTYIYPSVNFSGSVTFNNSNGTVTVTNNTGVAYDMRFGNSTNASSSGEEYAELFYFCPIE
jgi:hypothetical protein